MHRKIVGSPKRPARRFTAHELGNITSQLHYPKATRPATLSLAPSSLKLTSQALTQ